MNRSVNGFGLTLALMMLGSTASAQESSGEWRQTVALYGMGAAIEGDAILYTLVETAKLHGLDPARYLADAVRAADLGETRLPWLTNSFRRSASSSLMVSTACNTCSRGVT